MKLVVVKCEVFLHDLRNCKINLNRSFEFGIYTGSYLQDLVVVHGLASCSVCS